MMVMLKAGDGTIIDALPIGAGVDAAIFNRSTMETFSSQVDGTVVHPNPAGTASLRDDLIEHASHPPAG
jgi:hypothetical protein